VADISIIAENMSLDSQILDRMVSDHMSDDIEVVVTDPGYMRVLNRRYRHIDRPTDVLTFDLSEPGTAEPAGTIFVDGRLYPPIEELLERIFHGYLHLSGMSHDNEEDSCLMERRVRELVETAVSRSKDQ